MWKGLTWDHPRGFNALDAASRDTNVPGSGTIAWDVQPLEGFESAPIADLCARYDLVVLDQAFRSNIRVVRFEHENRLNSSKITPLRS
mgnify:CR=1 FL=1